MDGGGTDDLLDFSLDADGDVLFSLDGPSSRTAAPKPSGKFLPKIKGRAPKSELASVITNEVGVSRNQEDGFEAKPQLLPVKKQADDSRTVAAEFSGRDSAAEADDVVVDGTVSMDVDDVQEEDVVVREFDVHLSPSPLAVDTKLFVVQYPLRPSWRPYELDKICDVRVKPEQTLLEFDIATDCSENYDSEVDANPQQGTRTFSSSKAPLVTSHCVGLLKRNQLHLNPVNAVAQLRPSLDCMKSSKEKRPLARSQGNNVPSNEESGKVASEPSTSEDWVSVEFHSLESNISKRYKEKMKAQDGSNIPFSMRSCDYLANFCPGISMGTRGPPKQLLFTLPLEERLRIWFSQGPQVHRFSSLMHLTPKDFSKEDILGLLPQFAVLVQGLWVSKSSLLSEGYEALARDYILLLFTKSNVIPTQKLEPIKLPPVDLKQIMIRFARERTLKQSKDWKFREAADTEFLKCYSDSEIVRGQQCFWSNLEQHIESDLRINTTNSAAIRRGLAPRGPTTNSMDRTGGKNLSEGLGSATIPDQARDIISKAIIKVLRIHKVCRIGILCQKLRDIIINDAVISKRSPFAAAVLNFEPQSKEFRNIITEVSFEIHDVYVLKSIDATIDPFRKVVIDLLRGSPCDEKLKKAQIYAAAQKVLGKDIPNQEYMAVLNELCIFKGGGWVLKPGDGRPG